MSNTKVYDYQRYNTSVLSDANDSKGMIFNLVESNSVVLDVGCSCGMLGKVLYQKKNCEVYGFEYDAESVNYAQNLGCYKNVHRVDLNVLDESDFSEYYAKFDYIILADVIEHVIDSDMIISKLKKYLKDDGQFIFSIPNISHASIKTQILLNKWIYADTGLLDATHVKFFTRSSISELFTNCALKITYLDCVVNNISFMQDASLWSQLSFPVKYFILKDKESFVYQYIVVAKVQKNNSDLKAFNQYQLENNEELIQKRIKENKIRRWSNLFK